MTTTSAYVSGRAEGKTMRALLYAYQNPDTIFVTFNASEARRLANDNPLLQGRIVPANEVALFLKGKDFSGLVVDNAEIVLRQLLQTNAAIEFMTLTGRTVR